MRANFPPFTKPEAAYDSRRLYEETSAIAAAQDARLDKPDPVNAPAHYALGGREAIDVIESVAATVHDPVAAVLTSHALKYLMRWPRKGGITDLRKCRWYLERLIANVEAADCKAAPGRTQLDAAATGKPPLEPSRIATPGELSYLASCGPKWSPQWLADQGVPADPRKIARFHKDGSRIATEAEIAGLRELLTAEQLREYGIGDVEPATLRDIPDSFTDSHGCRITRRHPMHAEALRVADERTPEDLP